MYVLFIPAKKVSTSLTIEYKNINEILKKTFKHENEIIIDDILELIEITDKSNNIITDKYSSYLYDITSCVKYINILNDFCCWIKINKHYTNYLECVNDFKKNITDTTEIKILEFTLLPTINFFLNNKNSVYLRHGIEMYDPLNYSKNEVYPKKCAMCWADGVLIYNKETFESSWTNKNPKNNDCQIGYPIELDMFPFCETIDSYKNRKWPSDNQYGHCSNHDALFSWNKLKGYIPYKEFDKKGGKVIHSNKRDHLYAVSEINVYDWVFVFQNIEKNKEISKYWGWTQDHFNPIQYKIDISTIISNGGKIINQELLWLIYKLNW